jgi:hypothetical protein
MNNNSNKINCIETKLKYHSKGNSSKSSPNGEITVINGIISSPVLYSQQQHQIFNKNYLPILSKFEKLQIADSSTTPNISGIYLTTNEKNRTESLSFAEPLVSKASHDNESNDFYFENVSFFV